MATKNQNCERLILSAKTQMLIEDMVVIIMSPHKECPVVIRDIMLK